MKHVKKSLQWLALAALACSAAACTVEAGVDEPLGEHGQYVERPTCTREIGATLVGTGTGNGGGCTSASCHGKDRGPGVHELRSAPGCTRDLAAEPAAGVIAWGNGACHDNPSVVSQPRRDLPRFTP